MTAMVLLTLCGVGILVGIVSGLLGIGGGVLIVPFLYLFYGSPGLSGTEMPATLHTPVAHATSLFIILPTALRGVWLYQRNGLVVWRAVLPIAAAAAAAAVAGARIALKMPSTALEIGFALLLLGSSIRMMVPEKRAGGLRPRRVTPVRTTATGILVGLLSAMLGVGGGVVALPLLIYLIGLRVDELAATSLAVVMFAAAAGSTTYMLSGPPAGVMPAGSIGYVHAMAAIPILAGSILSVGWGTRLNRRLSNRVLRLIFGVLFTLVGLQILVGSILEMARAG